MMTASDWFGWALAIRRTPQWDHTADWRRGFLEQGKRLFFEIDPTMFGSDGQLYAGTTPTGRYRFVETAEAQAAFGERAWFRLEAPCEWVGSVAGWLTWDWWSAVKDRPFDIERFLGASKGYAVRLRDDVAFDIIAHNTYRLADANAKHGFGDGDDLPELGTAYEAYVWDQIERALDRIGLRARKINYGTSHNRIRFDELVAPKGPRLRDAWQQFELHRDDPITLWAYNNDRELLRTLIED